MTALLVTLLKVAFLALIWVFILMAAGVIRTDLFGRSVPTGEVTGRSRSRRKIAKGSPRRVVITSGLQTGIEADTSGPILIGRSSDCQLILDDDFVSTHHARITSDENANFVIEDLGSTNGTFVNGERITAPTLITTAENIRIGRTQMKLDV